jgi:hypothetical protein
VRFGINFKLTDCRCCGNERSIEDKVQFNPRMVNTDSRLRVKEEVQKLIFGDDLQGPQATKSKK